MKYNDATLLKWLAMRDDGQSAGQIAKAEGAPRGSVVRSLWKIDTQFKASEATQ